MQCVTRSMSIAFNNRNPVTVCTPAMHLPVVLVATWALLCGASTVSAAPLDPRAPGTQCPRPTLAFVAVGIASIGLRPVAAAVTAAKTKAADLLTADERYVLRAALKAEIAELQAARDRLGAEPLPASPLAMATDLPAKNVATAATRPPAPRTAATRPPAHRTAAAAPHPPPPRTAAEVEVVELAMPTVPQEGADGNMPTGTTIPGTLYRWLGWLA